MTIRLPKNPTGEQYEDLVRAWLLSLGYFVESRLVLRENGRDVLELDVVATAADSIRDRVLVEAKRGSASFADAFKLYGWRMYLGIESACIAHRSPLDEHHERAFAAMSTKTNVHTHLLNEDRTEPGPCLRNSTGARPDTADAVASAGWFREIALRSAYAGFLRRCRTAPDDQLCSDAVKYDRAVQASFFREKAIHRVDSLYDAYKATPRLTGQFVREVASTRGTTEVSI